MDNEGQAFSFVVRQLSDLRGEPASHIKSETRLYEDLGIYGDDWYDLVRALNSFGPIDWSGFDAHSYFKSEPNFLSPFVWFAEKARRTKRRPLTVGHLARVLAVGRWFQPPEHEREPREIPNDTGGSLRAAGGPVAEPEFPIRVIFHEDGDEWVLDSPEELACNLEWFDSDDPEENTSVVDRHGRTVRVKVEALEVLRLELVQP